MAATSSIFNTPLSTFNPSSTRRSTTARFTAAYTSIDRSTSTSHYEILGINSTATWQEIKQAYRKLARVSHPDVVSSGADEFMRIHSAYATLSDPEKRADYDRTIFGNRRGVNEFGLATASYGYARADTTSFGSRRWETDQCW